jgi:hypothetical protein
MISGDPGVEAMPSQSVARSRFVARSETRSMRVVMTG